MNVGIIGTGKIGAHLADSLLYSKYISNLFLTSRNREKLNGRIESLRLKKYFIGSKVQIEYLNWDDIERMDLIIISIKEDYDPRRLIQKNDYPNWLPKNLRYIGILQDLPLLKLISEKLLNFKGKIAVLTNPVELTSYFISKWIPTASVFGLGISLDSARMSYYLNQKGIKTGINELLLAGEHGNNLIPIQLEKIKVYNDSNDFKNILSISLKQSIEAGFNIVKNLGFTLHDCIPIFISDIEYLLSEPKSYRSFAIVDEGLCISKPISFCENGDYKALPLTNIERDFLNDLGCRIIGIINSIEAYY
jgi:malate/lactate dehydrogenase